MSEHRSIQIWRVAVIETATGRIERCFEKDSQAQAERLERGLEINLDHARFHVEVSQMGGVL